jgi:hypothetical protein
MPKHAKYNNCKYMNRKASKLCYYIMTAQLGRVAGQKMSYVTKESVSRTLYYPITFSNVLNPSSLIITFTYLFSKPYL